jgi:hypothetical protein
MKNALDEFERRIDPNFGNGLDDLDGFPELPSQNSFEEWWNNEKVPTSALSENGGRPPISKKRKRGAQNLERSRI